MTERTIPLNDAQPASAPRIAPRGVWLLEAMRHLLDEVTATKRA
jgi:hypothetical protein